MNIDLKKWFESDDDLIKYTDRDLEIIQQLKAIGLGKEYLEIWKLF